VRRRRQLVPRVKWPAWVSEYRPEEWADDRADAKWIGSLAPESEHAAELREWHRRGRWSRARDAWIDEHDPAYAQAEFERMLADICESS
jgi:hypothetical protein